MDHILGYDTETASLELKDGIVEHAFVEVDDDLNVIGECHSYITPPGPISPSAAGVHGITKKFLEEQNAPSVEQFWEGKGLPFKDKKVLMIAHNAPFDAKYLAPFVGELETLCTLKLARFAFPIDPEGQPADYVPPPDHKLPTLMHYLELPVKGTHNALDDVHTCLQLLERIGQKLGMTLEELYHLSKKPLLIKKMPFGKHKGTPLKELPRAYITWLKNLPDLDENIRWSLDQL